MSNSANTLLRELENERQNRRTPIQQEQLRRIEPIQPEKLYEDRQRLGYKGLLCLLYFLAIGYLINLMVERSWWCWSLAVLFVVVNFYYEVHSFFKHITMEIINYNELDMYYALYNVTISLNVIFSLLRLSDILQRLKLLIIFGEAISSLNILRLRMKYNMSIGIWRWIWYLLPPTHFVGLLIIIFR
tara:strand:- start:784 stop:1344 length:561 start_codon:yes stop_codon:yes gene_type:complete